MLSRPLLVISMTASQCYLFPVKHCTLTATLEMAKIYPNHLHFLSYLLECPVDNTGNGISEPLNLKISGGVCPQTVIPPTLELLRTSNFFPFAYTFKNLKLRSCYTNLENLLLKTV